MATSIDLNDELAEKIKKIALELGKTEATIIEEAINHYKSINNSSTNIEIDKDKINQILEEASRKIDEKFPERKKIKEELSKPGPDIEDLRIELKE